MASVNFLKIKSPQQAAQLLMHCDKAERANRSHANKEIDKSKTGENWQLWEMGARDTAQLWRDRIGDLDAMGNRNRRKDRVELFALETAIPAGVDPKEAAKAIVGLLQGRYGEENVVQAYLHVDELHTYTDRDGVQRESLPNLHAFVVPEIDGTLNGKQFSSAAAMRDLNRAIDRMMQREYGIEYLKNTDPERLQHKSVEELKRDSKAVEARTQAIAAKYRTAYQKKAAQLDDKHKQQTEGLKRKYHQTKDKLQAYADQITEKEKRLAAAVQDLQRREAAYRDIVADYNRQVQENADLLAQMQLRIVDRGDDKAVGYEEYDDYWDR